MWVTCFAIPTIESIAVLAQFRTMILTLSLKHGCWEPMEWCKVMSWMMIVFAAQHLHSKNVG